MMRCWCGTTPVTSIRYSFCFFIVVTCQFMFVAVWREDSGGAFDISLFHFDCNAMSFHSQKSVLFLRLVGNQVIHVVLQCTDSISLMERERYKRLLDALKQTLPACLYAIFQGNNSIDNKHNFNIYNIHKFS